MKTKTSITLSGGLLQDIDAHSSGFGGRAEFVEAAVGYYIERLERQRAEQRDAAILEQRADALNEEAADVLAYQVAL